MPKGPELSVELRVACVVMRYSGGMRHSAIAEELKLNPSTVRQTCSRVLKLAGSTELLVLLQHCGTRPRSGRPPQSPNPKKRKSRKAKRPSVKASAPRGDGGVVQSAADTAELPHTDTPDARLLQGLRQMAQQQEPDTGAFTAAPSVDQPWNIATDHFSTPATVANYQ